MSGTTPKTARLPASPDRRVQRTRALLLNAFNQLFFEYGYDGFSISDVVERANVGRSTFYQHFDNKDQVLRLSVARFYSVIADSCAQETLPADLPRVLAHCWENRRNAHALFTGGARPLLFTLLTELVEQRLSADMTSHVFPWRLGAAQIAAAQLGLLENWLEARQHCSPELAAELLHAQAFAGATSLRALAASRKLNL